MVKQHVANGKLRFTSVNLRPVSVTLKSGLARLRVEVAAVFARRVEALLAAALGPLLLGVFVGAQHVLVRLVVARLEVVGCDQD